MNPENEPKLAPPGAGLPKIELFVARLRFWWLRRRGNRERFNDHFERERDDILALAKSRDDASASRRVLIPRLRGLEDSSRYWSVWMTLDHLRIVNLGTAVVIRALLAGNPPQRVASTATVKPDPKVDASVTEKFKHSCADFLASVAGTADLQTKARYAHPWFGLLNAADWHALGGMHMRLHKHQIECILAGS
ncbi:MAG TPA: DinB family protein [Chthoniobacteraceae bacterium]|jgi:hypothetical protein